MAEARSSVRTIPLVAEARYELNKRRAESEYPELFDLLDEVRDPELPVLSIWDLGILQDIDVVRETGEEVVEVTITPTYSGCPAMGQIAEDIETALSHAGWAAVRIVHQLTPVWTTDWLDADARARLRSAGVAAPGKTTCPQCDSDDVELVSEFGSTACKSMWRCRSCLEPFDQFKQF